MERRGLILTRFEGPDLAAQALAEQVAGALRGGVTAHGTGSLAVPGGRTPLLFFQALRDTPLAWGKVSVTLTDERWVPETDPASNGALVRDSLLRDAAAAAQFVPLYDGSPSAAGATGSVWQALHLVPRPFDAVVLGMGEDGHFASLFAASPGVAEALDRRRQPACVAMRAPVAPHERMSLNLAALLQARRLYLLVNGAAKREMLLRAARGGDGELPISALLGLRHPALEVFWAP